MLQVQQSKSVGVVAQWFAGGVLVLVLGKGWGAKQAGVDARLA